MVALVHLAPTSARLYHQVCILACVCDHPLLAHAALRCPVLEQHPDPDVAPAEPAAPVVVDEDASATPPTALDTLSGATSKDVARGLGHPGGGVSNKEARRDWEAHQKAEGADRSQRSVAGAAARS